MHSSRHRVFLQCPDYWTNGKSRFPATRLQLGIESTRIRRVHVNFRTCSRTVGLCTGLSLLGFSVIIGQVADLPIKPGLWATRVSLDKDEPIEDQVCFSAGTTLKDYLTATNKGVSGAKCEINNKTQTAHGISYDSVCTSQDLNSKAHVDFKFSDSEHFSGNSHATVSGSMRDKPINSVMDKTFSASFIRSDCGSIKPLVLAPNK
jgi:hypothetical protein